MKLALPFLEKKEAKEYFLALVLRHEKASALIFEKIGTAIKPIDSDEAYFKDSVETATTEELLTTLDKIISQAESSLPPNIETKKTIFGLKENWIENNKIKHEYLDRLKKISGELDLTPVGFIVFSESLINLIQKEEGAPVTAILADIGKKYLTVSIVKAGKIVETKSSEIHDSASFTVDALLKHFQGPEILPSRVIIYDGDEEDLSQEFIGHQWSKSLPFLHLPQIVDLPANVYEKAMLYAAGIQMGAKVLEEFAAPTGEETTEERERIEPEEPLEVPQEKAVKEFTQPESPEEVTLEDKIEYVGEDTSSEFFGFIENKDIAKTPLAKPETKVEPAEESKIKSDNLMSVEENVGKEIEEIPEEVKLEQTAKGKTPAILMTSASLAKKTFGSLFTAFRKLPLRKVLSLTTKGRGVKLLIIPAVILVLVIGAVIFLLSKSSATITITLSPKEDQRTQSVTFSSDPTDIGSNTINSSVSTVSEDGSVTQSATGKKDVGDKAKGTVTIFSVDPSNSKTFPAGTTIVSADNKQFTTDSQVSLTAADPTVGPSKTDVNVTASDIGQDYNLPSGTKFTIGDDSLVAAKNDNAFSGGDKKQVTVVSKDDVTSAEDKLTGNLQPKATSDLKQKTSTDSDVLPQFVDTSISNESLDKKVNDQTSSFTLKATVNFKGAVYKKSDVLNLANSLFGSSSLVIDENNFSVEAKNIKSTDNGVTADLTVHAKLIPAIDTNSLKSQVAGFPLTKAQNLLSNLPQVANVSISISPSLPLLPKDLPKDTGKIKITVVSQ